MARKINGTRVAGIRKRMKESAWYISILFPLYLKHANTHQLLWHGSRTTNFVGILKQGLRIAPPEAPVSKQIIWTCLNMLILTLFKVTGYEFGKVFHFSISPES